VTGSPAQPGRPQPPEVLPPESTEDSGVSVTPADGDESTSGDVKPAALSPAEPRAGWFARTPLRVKLVAVMLALVSLALIVIGSASAFALRSYLVGRIDGQLQQQVPVYARELRGAPCEDTPIRIPSDFLVAIGKLDCSGLGYDRNTYTPDQLPSLPDSVDDAPHLNQPYTVHSVDKSHRWRLVTTELSTGEVLTVGEDLADVDSALDRLVAVNLLIGTLVLVTLALVGVWLIRASLKPLVDIERTAGAISRGDLTRRVPEQDPNTELGRLSIALNTMLSQIETAFLARAASEAQAVRSEERMRQFVADASHELRTPLTSIRGFAELYRQGAAPDPDDVLRRIEDEAARMGLLVEDLLLLARLDRERPLRHAPVHLAELITDAATAANAVAPDRTIEVDMGQSAGALVVSGDEGRLRQVIGNLVTNALTHTPAATPVRLGLRADGDDHAVIEVADRGPGLTDDQAERVFERFYRVDKARTRRASGLSHSGAGLGLAIVAALVAAHDGTVEVETAPGEGAIFRVRLPVAHPDEEPAEPA
jgi:two-component system, OmpR family, sensor kinase